MRRIFSRPDFFAGVRDMTPPLFGLLPFGLVCGVAAQALGAPLWGSLGLSAFIFSGAAQIVATQLIAAEAPVAVIVLTCFIVGLRFIMYSAAMAPHLKSLPPRWQRACRSCSPTSRSRRRSGAFAIRTTRAAVRRTSSAPASCCGAAWQVSNLIGYWPGNVIPAAWSLDFVVPLCFLAILVPVLEDRTDAHRGGRRRVRRRRARRTADAAVADLRGARGIAAGMIAERRRAR